MKVDEGAIYPLKPIKIGKNLFQSSTVETFSGKMKNAIAQLDLNGHEICWWETSSVLQKLENKSKADFLKLDKHNFDALTMDNRFAIKIGWENTAKQYLRNSPKDMALYQMPMVILLCNGDITPQRKRDLSDYAPNTIIAFADISEIYAGILIALSGIGFNNDNDRYASFDEYIIQAVRNGRVAYNGKSISTLGQKYEQVMSRLIADRFPYNTQFIDIPSAQNRRGALKYALLGAGLDAGKKLKPFPITQPVRKRITMIHSMIDSEFENHKILYLKDLLHMLQSSPFGMMFNCLDAFIVGTVIGSYEGKAMYMDECCLSLKYGFSEIIINQIIMGMADNFRGHKIMFDLNKDLTAFINIGARLYGIKDRGDDWYYTLSNFSIAISKWALKNRVFLGLLGIFYRKSEDYKNAEISDDIAKIVKMGNPDPRIKKNGDVPEVVNMLLLAEKIGAELGNFKALQVWMDKTLKLCENTEYKEMVDLPPNHSCESMWWNWPIEELKRQHTLVEKERSIQCDKNEVSLD